MKRRTKTAFASILPLYFLEPATYKVSLTFCHSTYTTQPQASRIHPSLHPSVRRQHALSTLFAMYYMFSLYFVPIFTQEGQDLILTTQNKQ